MITAIFWAIFYPETLDCAVTSSASLPHVDPVYAHIRDPSPAFFIKVMRSYISIAFPRDSALLNAIVDRWLNGEFLSTQDAHTITTLIERTRMGYFGPWLRIAVPGYLTSHPQLYDIGTLHYGTEHPIGWPLDTSRPPTQGTLFLPKMIIKDR